MGIFVCVCVVPEAKGTRRSKRNLLTSQSVQESNKLPRERMDPQVWKCEAKAVAVRAGLLAAGFIS